MPLRIIVTFFFLTFLLFGFTGSKKKEYAVGSVKALFISTSKIKSLTYQFYREERIDGKMVKNQSVIKMQRRPYKVYIKEILPNQGLEVLYPHPTYDGKALINPNGFPWVNLRLDPMSHLMRRNQHHTVLDGGFDYIVAVMEYSFYKHKTKINDMINYEGITLFDGQTCDMISFSNPSFDYINYTASKGESVSSIATKFRLNEYLILDKNEELSLSDDLVEGQIIKLPSDYAARIHIYVDRDRQIPLMVKVYDEKGLFEKYEFKDVIIDPEIPQSAFTASFPDYQFN